MAGAALVQEHLHQLQGVSKKRYFLGFLSYFSSGGRVLLKNNLFDRPIDLKIFSNILYGSKKIVKNFQSKKQPATWSKYVLKNTKKSKKSKISRKEHKGELQFIINC